MDKEAKLTNSILRLIKNASSAYWMKARERECLRIFHQAAKHVPAYRDFLKKNKIRPGNIKFWEDYQRVPLVSKENYLRKYKLKDLCWNGNLTKPLVFTATSGSTGQSVYFVRNSKLDWQYSVILEELLEEFTKEPTLVVICFGMGIWIGGLITYKAFELVANRRNFPISIITPGINKLEIIKAFKNLSPLYKQVILVGYPPFIKDIADELSDLNINLKNKKVRILFAAEAVTEGLRDYLAHKLHIENIYESFMNIYGSADIGAMAAESVASILVKRLAIGNKTVFNNLFNQIDKTPTLAQFNPLFINFEEVQGEIVLTGDSAMPLVRYAIGDNGGVFSYDEVATKFLGEGINFKKETKKAKIHKGLSKLPFVYVYERKDLSTTFYGLLIYPEWIKTVFFDKAVNRDLTGKFAMKTVYDKKADQYIEINVELRKGRKHTVALEKIVQDKIIKSLVNKSSEFREIYNNFKDRALPKLKFWPAEDPKFFKPGIKQKWSVK